MHVYHLVCLECMSSPRGAIVRAAMQSLCATKRCSSRIPSRSQNDTAAGIGLKDTYCTSYSTKRPAAVKFDHHQLSKRNKRTLYVFLSFKSLLGEKGRTCSLCFMSKGTTFSIEVANKLVSCCILCEGHVRHSFGAHFSLQKHQEEYHQHLSTASPLMHVLLSGESFDEDASIPPPTGARCVGNWADFERCPR